MRNVAASVRQRLMNRAREKNVELQRLFVLYALERLLYRLSVSPYADHFILKGASLFPLWLDEPHRRTRDLDLLGKDAPDPVRFAALFQDLCDLSVEDDGARFLPETVAARPIREGNEFGGVRVTLIAGLENARIPLQVDIGFGDAAVPEPEEVEYPTLLDGFAAPRLRAYHKETTIAEKLHALVTLERSNSRMKDFFDLYVLSREFPFAGERLTGAVRDVFAKRGTGIPIGVPDGLTPQFAADAAKRSQWQAFLHQSVAPPRDTVTLAEVVAAIAVFLLPVLDAAREETADGSGKGNAAEPGRWTPGGPWQTGKTPGQ